MGLEGAKRGRFSLLKTEYPKFFYCTLDFLFGSRFYRTETVVYFGLHFGSRSKNARKCDSADRKPSIRFSALLQNIVL